MNSSIHRDSPFVRAFAKLDAVLTSARNLWQPQPFVVDDLPWAHTRAHVRDALLGLGDEETRQLHDQPEQRRAWFEQYEPELCQALHAYEPKPSTVHSQPELQKGDRASIPARKWQQIQSFVGALPQHNLPAVDWCAGKGHLGRTLQRSLEQPVYCLEWNGALVAGGEALAQQQGLDIRYHHHDVMQPLPVECEDGAAFHVGLHACGKLHHQLLRQVVGCAVSAVALSPCCYHKTADELFQPLSEAAQQSRLCLDRVGLHLAVQDTVSARPAERQLREQERLWRLGFDALQRELRGVDDYLPVRSCKREQLRGSFPNFCHWAAQQCQLKIPDSVHYEEYLQRGREKHRIIVRLELVRKLFSRPLELWLVLDCALYLQEQGYRVDVSQFCEHNISPRNLLIQAELY